MSTPEHPLLRFDASSRSFLNLAREQLAEFDQTQEIPPFLQAALYLRLGIEARVTEYLEAELRQIGKTHAKINDYVASKLLRRLEETNSFTTSEGSVTVRLDQNPEQTSHSKYTPVTKELASMHGKLGEILHYKFFRNNKYWYINQRLDGQEKSVLDYRDFLETVADELQNAVSGHLLTHPVFRKLVKQVLEGEAAMES